MTNKMPIKKSPSNQNNFVEFFNKILSFTKRRSGKVGNDGTIDVRDYLRLDKLRLLKTLGTGSFGRVFLAEITECPSYGPIALKRLTKSAIIKLKQVDHIISEKNILMIISHPFIVKYLGSFHNEKYLFIAMEYVAGGEFFTLLRKRRFFSNDSARFYASQIVSIFEYLHSNKIIYRDLKPENLLVAPDGYLRLADFGFAKIVEHSTYTLCGTPEYLAPEILLSKGHGKAVDWWTLGIIIYEMLVGYPPFFDDEPLQIYQKIIGGKISYPKVFDRDAKSLVRRLLTADLSKRYGNLKDGANDVKWHRWFLPISWSALTEKSITPPYKPNVKSPSDSSHFDYYSETCEEPEPVDPISDPFKNW